jgi:hypothetical protein
MTRRSRITQFRTRPPGEKSGGQKGRGYDEAVGAQPALLNQENACQLGPGTDYLITPQSSMSKNRQDLPRHQGLRRRLGLAQHTHDPAVVVA